MNKEQEKEAVRSLLEEAVHGVFRARQEVHGIESGDIEPLAFLKLDALQDLLADHIAFCIMQEVAYGKE